MPAALDAKKKAEIVDRLFVVFQDHGYEGASLADLSRATGLGKSSLYHHFPGGKEQMAEAVLGKGKAFMQTAVADVAKSSEPLKGRIRKRLILRLPILSSLIRRRLILSQATQRSRPPTVRESPA